MAAVLACGPGAVLSHRSVAELLGIRWAESLLIDVSTPGRRGHRRPGIVVHSGDVLTEVDLTVVSGIPATTVARTLLDLASVVGPDALRRACREAEVQRLFDLRAVNDLLNRSRGRRGVRVLRNVVEGMGEPSHTRSELEERFLGLCLQAGLPRPSVNSTVEVAGEILEVDFAWPSHHLVVEADGRLFHDTASAFERDRRRDQLLARAGWRVIRCTWRQATREPGDLVATIRSLLTA